MRPLIILSTCLLAFPNSFSRGEELNIGCNNDDQVVSLKLLYPYGLFWSISSANGQRLADNAEGKLHVGVEGTVFCMTSPGLDGNQNSISLQLFGHSGLYVNIRSPNGVYLDKIDGTLASNRSASLNVTQKVSQKAPRVLGGQNVNVSSAIYEGLNFTFDSSFALVLGGNLGAFEVVVPANLAAMKSNVGFDQSTWSAYPEPWTQFDRDSVISTRPDNISTIANLLPLNLETDPLSFYRFQGYFRPYFHNSFVFRVNCKFHCELLVEQADRTVKNCSGLTDCGPIFLYGGSTHAYYYVEFLVFPGPHIGHAAVDIFTQKAGVKQPLKFAEFKKVEYGREAHRWTFTKIGSSVYLDELLLASFAKVGSSGPTVSSGEAHFDNGGTMIARKLILNFGNFPWENEAGFTIGFWFRPVQGGPHKGIAVIWSESAFEIMYSPGTDEFVLTFNVKFHSTTHSLTVRTQYRFVHFIFTWSPLNGPKCYRNGYLSVDSWKNGSFKTIQRGRSELFIGSSSGYSFSVTELVLWRNEITSDQVLDEYKVSCGVYYSTCRWRNKEPDEGLEKWHVWIRSVPSYLFTGPSYSKGYYFYMEASQKQVYSRAILQSPVVVQAFKCLEFRYFMFGDGMGQLMVASEAFNDTRKVLWLLVGQQQNKNSLWKTASVPISSQTGSLRIFIEGIRGVNFRSDIAVSDIKFKEDLCPTTPLGAYPITQSRYSCKPPCPENFACLNRTRRCSCDTRYTNYINTSCLDDMKNSTYHDAVYFWPMDKLVSVDYDEVNTSLIMGVANNAILIGSTALKITFNHTWSEKFTFSSWIKIRNDSGYVLAIVIPDGSVIIFLYNAKSQHFRVDFKEKSSYSCDSYYYHLKPDIFFHTVFVWSGFKLDFYRNGIVQSPYKFQDQVPCVKHERATVPTLRLFSGSAFDDVAVWFTNLNAKHVSGIFTRYTQYKSLDGSHYNQPLIIEIKGVWNTNDILDEDGVVKEELQTDIYYELFALSTTVQDTITTQSWNGTHNVAKVTLFLSASTLWKQRSIRYNLMKKSNLAGVLTIHRVSSKYVTDVPPYDLTVAAVNQTYFKLSWKFTSQEKLSPFQGFLLFYKTRDSLKYRQKIIIESIVPEAEVFNLLPFTEYRVFVCSQHLLGLGFVSDEFRLWTNVTVPPQNFTVMSPSSSSLNITWSNVPVEYRNGEITGYEITLHDVLENVSENISIYNESQFTFVRDGLKTFYNYSVRIAAKTSAGLGEYSSWIETKTLEDIPSASPQDVKVIPLSSSSLKITWSNVPMEYRNGKITGYEIMLNDVLENVSENISIYNQSQLTFVRDGLKKFYNYSVQIAAKTSVGRGEYSSLIGTKTLEDIPSAPPQNVIVIPLSSSSLELSWLNVPVEYRNGKITGYEIVVHDVLESTSENITIHTQSPLVFQKDGLKKYYNYSVRIAAKTSVGRGEYSSWIETKTLEDVPSAPPQNVTVITLSSSSLAISWSNVPVKYRNGEITGYEIVLYDVLENVSENIPIYNQSQFVFVKDALKKYYNYSVRIAALTSVGVGEYSSWIKTKTLEDFPSAPPQNITVIPLSSSSLKITWSNVPVEYRNGEITGYEIMLYDGLQSTIENATIYNQSQFLFVTNGLKKYYNYSIRIAAKTSVGRGEYSSWIETKTLEDVPSAPPQNFTVIVLSSSSLKITWSNVPLEYRNGEITGYEIMLYDMLETTSDNLTIHNQSQLVFVKDGLKKYYNYSIRIAAKTSVGLGQYSSWIETKTLEDTPSAPPQNVTVIPLSSSSLEITWSNVPVKYRNGEITGYEIILHDVLENVSENIPIYNQSQFVFVKDALKKYYKYSVRMVAKTSVGLGEYSSWIEIKTLEDRPCSSPQNLSVLVLVSPLKYQITWKPMKTSEFCGQPRGYTVMFGVVNTSHAMNYSSVTVAYTDSNLTFSNELIRFVYYEVTVAAFTSIGKGPEIGLTFYVNDVPSSAPVNVSVFNTSSTSLLVQWSLIPKKHGVATGYMFLCRCVSCEEPSETIKFSINGSSIRHEIRGLKVFSNYSVQMAAFTEIGPGNYSAPVFSLTDEAIPQVAPANVSLLSTSRHNLTVFWSFVSSTWGKITSYCVKFGQVSDNETFHYAGKKCVSFDTSYKTFGGLQRYTTYAFEVEAWTRKGFGPPSARTFGRTLVGDPIICPVWAAMFNVSSRSVDLTWHPLDPVSVPGGLSSYEIVYWINQTGFSDEIHVVNTRSIQTIFHLGELEESVKYNIRIRASMVRKEFYSPAPCPVYNVTTKDDVPDASPPNTSKASVTSTSITVQWKPIPLSRMNGVLLGYQLNYSLSRRVYRARRKRNSENVENQIFSVSLGPNVLSYVITGLKKFTAYSITVAGFNANGNGPFSEHVDILTAEDVPSKPPVNVRVLNHVGPTSLLLRWKPVPHQFLHGILAGYKVQYKAVEQGEKKIWSETFEINVPAHKNMIKITNLTSYTRYQVSVLAKTKAGNGVSSNLVFGETCRCHQTLMTNWWQIKPYMGITKNASLDGVFPIVIQRMVKSCCQFCLTHDTTKLDFFGKFSGEVDAEYFKKRSLEDVKRNVSENSDLSFPVYGSSQDEKYGAFYGYVPLVRSPGDALIVNREPKYSPGGVLHTTVINSWPLTLLVLVFSILAGITIWILEYRSNPQQFPPRFLCGVYHGTWWAIVTSSTVGYGDCRPKTLAGRTFAIIWTLAGQIVLVMLTSSITRDLTTYTLTVDTALYGKQNELEMLTSSITRDLTTYTLTVDTALYGKQIAAIQNSPQHNFAIRRNAEVEPVYRSVKDMVSALKTKKVEGLIVDTYVAGARKDLFSEFFRVRKVFDRISAYGIVLAGDTIKLQHCFSKYIRANQGSIFHEIHKVVESIEEPPQSEAVSRSTQLFDADSIYTRKSLLLSGIVLVVFAVIGFFLEFIRRRRKKSKVKPKLLSSVACERKKLTEGFRQEVRIFVKRIITLYVELRTRHMEELRKLTHLKKACLFNEGSRTASTQGR